MNTRLKVLCILPSIGHAHFAKRIAMMQEAGIDVEAVGFERTGHFVGSPDCRMESLGWLHHGRYFLRGMRLAACCPKVRAALERNDIAYAFSPDMALVALAAGVGLRKPVVLEVADVRGLQVAWSAAGRLFRRIDRRATDACSLLVVTSPHYYRYYRDWLNVKTPGLTIENKVAPAFADRIAPRGQAAPADGPPADRPLRIGFFHDVAAGRGAFGDRRLRIGFFGILRDEWSLKVIESVSRTSPQKFAFVLAGVPGKYTGGVLQRLAGLPNVKRLGPYRNPADLPSLFGQVDMVLACYPLEIPKKWSRSNRYYDACLFRKPLIVRDGSADAAKTRRHDIGLVIKDRSIEAAAAALHGIAAKDWQRWRANMASLPRKLYVSSTEGDALRRALNRIAAGTTG